MTDVTALITCMTDNEQPYIEEAIASVLAQTYTCHVIVLLNKTSTKFGGFEEKFPSVQFIRTDIRPPGAMRNFGVSFVNTRWVAFLDGDDLWHSKKIEVQLEAALDGDAQLFGCDYRLIDETSNVFACALSNVIAAPSSWFAATEIMCRYKFQEESMIAEDVKWWNDYVRGGAIKTKRVPRFLLDYRVRGSSLSEGSIPGRRKRAIKKLALSFPGARWVLLGATWLAYFSLRSTDYKASRTR